MLGSLDQQTAAAMSDSNEYGRLHDILSSPEQHAFFETFLQNIHAHENLLFIEALSELRHETDNSSNIQNIIHRISKTFLIPNSPLEINVQNKKKLRQLTERFNKEGVISRKEALELLNEAELELKIFLNEKIIEFDHIYRPVKINIHDPEYVRFQKKVVIIGGGFTGFTVASILDPMPRFHVTLIDTKDSFEYTPGMIKLLVRPEETSSLRVRHDSYVKNGRVIIGYAERIVSKSEAVAISDVDVGAVKVDSEYIPFDYLVIATGSSYQSKLKSFDISSVYRLSELATEHKQLREAKSVLIIGGGLVGCELANEIATHCYPSPYDKKKKITLIDSHSTLVQRSPPKKQQDTLQYFERLGVEVILNEKIIDFDSQDTNSFLGSSGTVYSGYDKVFQATGSTLCNKIMLDSIEDFPSCVDSNGRIRVKPTLQLNHFEYPYIFSGGDITNMVEEKTGYAATLAGACIARNICRMEKGKPPLEQGTKGTLPAPKGPLHDAETYGGVGRQEPLNSLKKAFFFLNPTWAALKYFDEKEFLTLVQGEARSIAASSFIGKKPRKLGLPCEYYKCCSANGFCNKVTFNASFRPHKATTTTTIPTTHSHKATLLAPYEAHHASSTTTTLNLPLRVSAVNLSGSDVISTAMQGLELHKLSFEEEGLCCYHDGVPPSSFYKSCKSDPSLIFDSKGAKPSFNDESRPTVFSQHPTGMASQLSLRSLKYFDLQREPSSNESSS